MCLPKILFPVFMFRFIFSMPPIFTSLAAGIYHFLTAAVKFSFLSYNEIRLLCFQSLALALSLLSMWVWTSKITSKKTWLQLLLFFFFLFNPIGHAISFQIKPWVAFGLPYLIELFNIGVPVVRTDWRSGGRAVGRTYGYLTTKISRMHRLPNFLNGGAPLRALRARELRYY